MKVRSPSGDSLKKGLSDDLENWMGKLPQALKGVPLTELAIPGSHDSFTSDISADSELAPDANQILQWLQCFGSITNYFVANWSKTQSFLALEQLKRGIRYFDLRLATKSDSDEFFICHGLYSVEVSVVLTEIEGFLETHPGEVVILDFQHFYAFEKKDHDLLMQQITATFKTKLMPYTEHIDIFNLEYMSQWHYQVVIVYRSDVVRFGQPLFWPATAFPNPWFDTTDKTELFGDLDDGLGNRDSKTAYISQCVLTPSVGFIVLHLFSTLKEKCAVDFANDRTQWIKKHEPGGRQLNIIIVDFIELDDNSYVKDVIDLNVDVLKHINKRNLGNMPQVHTH